MLRPVARHFVGTIIGIALVGTLCAPSFAADAFDAAYAPYRAASNYLRTENTGLASLDLAATLDAWQKVADSPAPAALAKDPQYKETVDKISAALALGMEKTEMGDPKAALAAIKPVRQLLMDLRRRNGIDTYADCITELNYVMDDIYVYRRPDPNMSDPAVVKNMRTLSEKYAGIIAKCRTLAPGDISADPEFVRLFDSTAESVASMLPAIDSGSANRVVNVIRELRSYDRIIFFRFGG